LTPLFGLADAAGLSFFPALQYIPLGIAAAIAFLGPLGLAVATSRRPLHFLCIGVAALGIGLLTPEIGSGLDPRGLGLAAVGALGWAAFVLLSKKLGGSSMAMTDSPSAWPSRA
jgi:inner membrane transporter RhtA